MNTTGELGGEEKRMRCDWFVQWREKGGGCLTLNGKRVTNHCKSNSGGLGGGQRGALVILRKSTFRNTRKGGGGDQFLQLTGKNVIAKTEEILC